MRYFVWLGLVCVSCTFGISQEKNYIFLNNDLVAPPSGEGRSLDAEWPSNNCDDNNRCFAILQLDIIPDDQQVHALSVLGIDLIEYIPNRAYLASHNGGGELSLPDFVEQVLSVETQHKRPNGPLFSSEGAESDPFYELVGIPFPGISTISLAASLHSIGADLLGSSPEQISYRIPAELLPDILACPKLLYTEATPGLPQAEGAGARSSGRVGALNSGPGLGYDGSGVAMAIGDDGSVNHLDLQGRLIDFTNYNTGNHGELTVGMAAAAGNIDPKTMGAAPGVSVYLYDISTHDHLLEALLNYTQYRIVITSTSYGDGCGESYELSARQIDAQVYQLQQLFHTFSVGNHGLAPCFNAYSLLGPAPDGSYHNTITGGRKTAKNVVSVGNTYSSDVLVPTSSRGPTTDGRLKPEIVVMGQLDHTIGPNNTFQLSSGTSAAAPTVAGVAAALYEYYRSTHGDQDPSSALIKAVLLNAADDLGLEGPDFSYGWGRLNGRKALRILQQQHYFNGSISHGQLQSFNLQVPAGTVRLKAMLYWHDPAGSLLSARALVNDLDFTVQTPNGQQQRPWLPSHNPNIDSLNRSALPGIDRLNNAEQVVINTPQAGTYTLRVNGFQIPQGPQQYYLVYELEQEPMAFSYPQAGSTFVPNDQVLLSWDAVDNSSFFGLDYSLNGGQSWQIINNFIAGNQRNYLWTVPNQLSHQLKFRLRRGTQQTLSAGSAVLSPTVDFSVGFQTANTALVSWQPVSGAVSYQVYRMGERYMEVVGTSSGTTHPVPATVGASDWFSVAPVFANNLSGQRAIAKYYEHFGCESNVRMSFQFDRYPGQTTWYILDSESNIRHTGGPYTNLPEFSSYEEIVCLPEGCFTLVVSDSNNNGMCCGDGNGWFQLSDIYGNELASGGNFSNIDYELFCLEADNNTPDLAIEVGIISLPDCNGGNGGSASVMASGGSGNYAYSWSTGNTTPSLLNVGTGTYSVTVTDGQQSQSASVFISEPTAINVLTSSQAANCNDGSISLQITGGQAPYSVSWVDGFTGSNRGALAAGDYFALVQDANGCVSSQVVNVAVGSPINLSLSSQNPSCQAGNSGSILASASGGNGNYQYFWSTGSFGFPQLSGLASGTYSVTVSDGNCQVSASTSLTVPAGFSSQLQTNHPSCANGNDGVITVNNIGGVPPFNYQWSTGQSSAQLFNLGAGLYQVTVTDALGCSSMRSTVLNSHTPLQVSTQTQDATPNNGGSIQLSVSGGSAPYQIIWNTGATGNQLINLAAGNYSAQVIDQQNCFTNVTVTVGFDEPNNPEPGYCPVTGVNTNYEWIASLKWNGVDYNSGNDGGYGDYTHLDLPITPGGLQQITLTVAYASTLYREHWKVWIDYNDDEDFDDLGEEVLSLGPVFGSVTGSFVAPSGGSGHRRMRVSMQYGSSPSPCTNPNYGEVEDYTISWTTTNTQETIVGMNSTTTHTQLPAQAINTPNWLAYPNPSRGQTQISGDIRTEGSFSLQLMDAQGRIVLQEQHEAGAGRWRGQLHMEPLKPGIYFLRLSGTDWQESLRILKM